MRFTIIILPKKNDHAYVIYNGIAKRSRFDKLHIQDNRIHKDDRYIFAIIGSITAKKGQENAINAIGTLHERGYNIKLIIAGSGKVEYVGKCKQLVDSIGLNNIVDFYGFVDEPNEIYHNINCLLMCSENDGLPRVVIEAMSNCLPVIGKNSGGTQEIIEHEKNGLLYNTFEELVVSMVRMVENPEWGCELGLAGWHRQWSASISKIMRLMSIKSSNRYREERCSELGKTTPLNCFLSPTISPNS